MFLYWSELALGIWNLGCQLFLRMLLVTINLGTSKFMGAKYIILRVRWSQANSLTHPFYKRKFITTEKKSFVIIGSRWVSLFSIYAVCICFHFLGSIEKKDKRSLVSVKNSFVIIRACVRNLKPEVLIHFLLL